MTPLTVCTFFWHDPARQRSYTFTHDHVRVLKGMVDRHLSLPHRFVCITDDRIDGIETVPIDWRTHVPGTCGIKLMAWRPDIGEVLGCERVLTLDLDIVLVASIEPLVSRVDEPVTLWRNPNYVQGGRRAFYQGSVQLHDAGAHPEVWTEIFRPGAARIVNRRFGGFEQAWLSEVLPWDLPHWTSADGLYGAGRIGDHTAGVGGELPANARIVSFPGNRAPHQSEMQERFPWLKEHYVDLHPLVA